MTHLQPTTTIAGPVVRPLSPQTQGPAQAQAGDASPRPTQEPPYPPGLGFSPVFRSIALARSIDIPGEVVVHNGTGSSLLEEPLVVST